MPSANPRGCRYPRRMKAVILAGGLGTRLSEETATRPKPMVELGGRPVLWHIMKTYSAYGIDDFIVCCGYKGYVIKEFFANYALHASDVTFDMRERSMRVHNSAVEPWTVTLVDTGDDTMTGGRLLRVRNYVGDEPFCFTYGDGLSDVDVRAVIEHHRASGALATMTTVQPPGRFGAVRLEEQKIVAFDEKPHGDGAWINGGYFVLSPGVFDYIDGDDTVWEREPLERLAFPHRVVAVDVVEDAGREHEVAAVDPGAVPVRLLVERDDLLFLQSHRAEASGRLHRRHRRQGAGGTMVLDHRAHVDVGETVAVGEAERFVADVVAHPQQPAAGHRVVAGVDQGHRPRFDGTVVDAHRALAHVEGDVRRVERVIGEELLDDVALVSAADDEVVDAVGRIRLHDMPEHRPAAELHHRLRASRRLLAESRAEAARQDHRLHPSRVSASAGVG